MILARRHGFVEDIVVYIPTCNSINARAMFLEIEKDTPSVDVIFSRQMFRVGRVRTGVHFLVFSMVLYIY